MPAEPYQSGETIADWPQCCGSVALITEYEIGAKKPLYHAKCVKCGRRTKKYRALEEACEEARGWARSMF